jgi:hypothetical protein
MCSAQVLSWKMKTLNRGLVYRDVLQLGKYGTSKEFFCLNPLAYTAGCETGWAIDAFAVNSGFGSADGMTCLIPFESWRNDL